MLLSLVIASCAVLYQLLVTARDYRSVLSLCGGTATGGGGAGTIGRGGRLLCGRGDVGVSVMLE